VAGQLQCIRSLQQQLREKQALVAQLGEQVAGKKQRPAAAR
jgi:hypothetical protein